MAFKSYMGRSMDLGLRSNQAIIAITGLCFAASLALALMGRPWNVLLSGAAAFLSWAWVRELDPDHNWTALLAAVGFAVLALSDHQLVSVAAIFGLMATGRLLVRTTGRRPLTRDIVGLGILAVAIAYTTVGWIVGLGLAAAVWWDNALDERQSRISNRITAILAPLGATLVAVVFEAIPTQGPTESGAVTVVTIAVVLVLVLRRTATPTTLVDARHKSPISPDRLRKGRWLTALAVAVTSTVIDPADVWPLTAALVLVVLSNELALHRETAG